MERQQFANLVTPTAPPAHEDGPSRRFFHASAKRIDPSSAKHQDRFTTTGAVDESSPQRFQREGEIAFLRPVFSRLVSHGSPVERCLIVRCGRSLV